MCRYGFFRSYKEVNIRVKLANENLFSCTTFKKNLRAYIDNELSGHLKAEFITHASQCRTCNTALNDMEGVIRILSNLEQRTHVSASQDFNFSLKTRILLEKDRLRNPFYRISLYFREKIRYFLAVPAFALVVFAIVFLYSGSSVDDGSFFRGTMLRGIISVFQLQKSADLVSMDEKNPDEIVYIYYVLETVHSTEDNISEQTGMSGSGVPAERVQTANTFTTVSF